jgi:hypothetical protein
MMGCFICALLGRLMNSVTLCALIWIGCFILPKFLVDHGEKVQFYLSSFSNIENWTEIIQNKVSERLNNLSGKQKKQ